MDDLDEPLNMPVPSGASVPVREVSTINVGRLARPGEIFAGSGQFSPRGFVCRHLLGIETDSRLIWGRLRVRAGIAPPGGSI